MPRKVNVAGTWRTVQQMYTNVNGTWVRAQRVYVNQNGTWKFAYARTPGVPQNLSLTVNGSSNTSQTTNTSPASAQVTWSVPGADANLPVGVKWYINSTQVGGEDNITTGTSASTTVSLSAGESKNIYAVVRFRNGQANSLSSNDVYGSSTGSISISLSWPNPTITNMSLSPNYAGDYLTVYWTANNPPSGVSYSVGFYDNYLYNTEQSGGSTTGTSFQLNLGPGYYGYDLQQDPADNTYVQFTVTVYMYDSSNTVVAQNEITGTYLVGI